MTNVLIDSGAECCKCSCEYLNIATCIIVLFVTVALCIIVCRISNCIKECQRQKLEHERLLLQSCIKERNNTNKK